MKNLFNILIISILLFSCEKELDIDLPYDGDKLVVFGVLCPDKIITIKLTKTVPPTGLNELGEGVNNAIVKLFEEGKMVEILKYTSKGDYVSPSNFMPKVGKKYYIEAKAEGFPEITSEPEIIPSKVQSIDFTFGEDITSPVSAGTPAKRLVLEFDDDISETDFYAIIPEVSSKDRILVVNAFNLARNFGSPADACGFDGNGNIFCYTDVCFSGKAKSKIGVEIKGGLQGKDFDFQNPDTYNKKDADKIIFRIRKITKNYYDYILTDGELDGIFKAFVPTISRQSNIKGGYGVLVAYNETVIKAL
jgi:hypothetical protein